MLNVRDDQPGAFEELVEHYQNRLVGVLHHLVGNATEAEDLAQEVFLRVYRARKKYRCALQVLDLAIHDRQQSGFELPAPRQRKPVVPLNTRDSGPLGPRPAERLVKDSGSQPSKRIQQQEMAAVVRKALDGLNERQRMAVLLNKFEDMNYAEIAEVMGLTTKGVKSLLCRARTNLPRSCRATSTWMANQCHRRRTTNSE